MNENKKALDNFFELVRSSRVKAPVSIEQEVMRRIRLLESKKQRRIYSWPEFSLRKVCVALGCLSLVLFLALFVVSPNAGARSMRGYKMISFSFSYPGAKEITLVGDFNKWHKNKDRLVKLNGKWSIKKSLKKGQFYKYAFVVDNKKVIVDSRAKQFMPDGFGGRSSVVFVN